MIRGWRYWLILVGELAGFVFAGMGLATLAYHTVLRVELFSDHWPRIVPSYLSLVTLVFVMPGILAVLLHLIFHDQRFRCRVCGRRLRMPIEHGSLGHPMTAPPGMDYVCPYGHGKLVTETWVSGDPPDEWTEYGDIWEELFTRR